MIRIVLDHPQDLVNIAHVVRAMKNFALTDLALVEPAEYDEYRIEGIAHRSADLLKGVRRFGALDEALADCVHVVGFTARGRTAKRNVQRPRAAAAEILAMAEQGPVALLFGREDKGLSNEDLDRCNRAVVIPTDPAYPSMNLGHAVAVMLYELAIARGEESRALKPPRREAPPAPAELVEELVARVEKALEAIDFFKGKERSLVMRTVREVVHRTPLDQREAKLIRAMAIETVKQASPP
ncbi:MAG: RNA methyltransferase [Gemmatimonadales bacterium]